MKHTKKSLLAELNAAQSVVVTMVGGLALEDIPTMRDELLAKGFEELPDKFVRATQYFTKPKFSRIRTGKFKSSSTRYTFTWEGKDSSGDVAHLRVVDDHLELTMLSGAALQYRAVK